MGREKMTQHIGYALVESGSVSKYPYSDGQLRQDLKAQNTSPPRVLDDAYRASHDMVPVYQEAAPTITDTQVLTQDATPTRIDDQWVLGWTVRDKTAEELAAELTAKREAASLSREGFAIAAHGQALLSEAEAEDWAGGVSIPAAIVAAINSGLPEGERLKARIHAKTTLEIRRSAPLISLLQAALNLTDDQVDGLFGIA
jgi:hypothetical protein